MNLYNLDVAIDKIYEMQQDADDKRGYKKPIFTHLAKLMEEVGEFSEAALMIDGYKTNDVDKAVVVKELKKEIVDIIIMGVVLGHQMGMTKAEILETMEEKLDKWQAKHIDPLYTGN